MLRGCQCAILQHIINLLADLAVMTAGQSVPKLLLCGFQLLFHSLVFTVPKPGRPEHRFTCREVVKLYKIVNL